MTIQRVLHLNQNVSLHHRLSSSPFLFMFFFFFFFFLFFWDSCKGFCLFDQKKRKKEKSFFLRFSSSLFSSFPAPLKETKKRALFFFFYYLTRTNERTRMRRWDWKVRQEEESKKTTLDWRRYFSFFVVSFCVLVFWSGCCFVSRGEREGTTKKAQKRKEKILSVQKIRVPLLLLLFSVPKKRRAAKERRGVTNIFWIVSKTFSYHSIIIPIGVINLNTRTHTYI